MKLFAIAGIAALALATAALAGVAAPDAASGAEAPDQRVVTVSGSAVVESVPDEAYFSFGVVSNGRTAREAMTANGIEVGRVLLALRRAGVDERDLRTEHVSLMPRYSDEGQEIVGYAASNTVSAELRRLAGAGAIVDAAVEAGANHVYGPEMTRSNQEELYRRALRAAIENARARAQAIAAASGVSLGAVVSVSETGVAPSPVPISRELAAPASTPIEPGTHETEATVTVTFALA